MTQPLDISNPNSWEEFFSTTVTATTISSSTHAPIPETVIPFPLASRVLVAKISTSIPSGSNWKFGGYLKQTVGVGIPSISSAFLSSRRLLLDTNKLIVFPSISSTYNISVSVPSWFKDFTLIIWKYTGSDVVNL